jgi:hypothetical protein
MLVIEKLAQIQSYLSVVGAISGWGLLLTVLSRTCFLGSPLNRLTLYTIGFLLTFSFGILFEIHTLFSALYALTGINNLAWLCAAVGITSNTYFMAQVMWEIGKGKNLPPLFTYLYGLSLLSNFLLFGAIIQHTPDYPGHVLPRQFGDVLFLLSSFLFGSLATGLATLASYHSFQAEKNLFTHVRWGISTTVCFFAAAYFVLRTTLTIITGITFNETLAIVIYSLALISQFGVSFLSPLTFASNEALQKLITPFQLLNDWWILYQLYPIHQRVSQAHQPIAVFATEPGLVERLKNSKFYIYRMIIDILDGKMNLNKQAKLNRLQPENKVLLTLLNQVEDEADYPIVVKRYCQISHKFKQGQPYGI